MDNLKVSNRGPSMDELIKKVQHWGLERGIIQNGNPMTQSIKTLEEVQELLKAVDLDDEAEQMDAIGDIIVTLIMQAGQCGFSINECLEGSYNEIKDRKGKLNKKGDFIKER